MALKYEKSCGALVFRQDPKTGRMYILMIRHKHGGHRSFPKGHVEAGETEHQTAIREVEEETGLTMEDPVLCGVTQFPTDNGERYIVLFFRATRCHGTLHGSVEGEVSWVDPSELPQLNLTPSLMDYLSIINSDSLSELYWEKRAGEWISTLF